MSKQGAKQSLNVVKNITVVVSAALKNFHKWKTRKKGLGEDN